MVDPGFNHLNYSQAYPRLVVDVHPTAWVLILLHVGQTSLTNVRSPCPQVDIYIPVSSKQTQYSQNNILTPLEGVCKKESEKITIA